MTQAAAVTLLAARRRRPAARIEALSPALWLRRDQGVSVDGSNNLLSWTDTKRGLVGTPANGVVVDTYDTLSSPRFDATDSHIDVPLAIGADWSITALFAGKPTIANGDMGFASLLSAGTRVGGFFHNSSSELYAWYPFPTNRSPVSYASAARAVVGFVATPTYAAIYVNGIKLGEATYSATAPAADTIRLGRLGTIYPFGGAMHHALLFLADHRSRMADLSAALTSLT